MLPHANTLAGLTNSLPAVQLTSNNIPAVQFTSNNIPTVRLVSVPAWDVYNTEYGSYDSEECQLEDGAGNFEALARRSGIKVSYPAQETAENHHGATANLSATATEFVPRSALSPETVVPENLQPATLLQPSRSSVTATSPLNEDKKLLEMFQEVLNEKKQQKKILQDCIKNRDESKATISSLTNEKAALKEEIEKLTEMKERNSMLSQEVEGLTERLIEFDRDNSRLKLQVAALAHKLQEVESRHDSDQTRVTSLLSKLNETEAEKERAVKEAKDLSQKYEILLKENERALKAADDLSQKYEMLVNENESVKTRATTLEDELTQKIFDKTILRTEIMDLKCQLKESKHDNEREKQPAISSSKKKMDSLDCIAAVDNEESNWTVVRRKGAKITTSCESQNHAKKVKSKRSQSLDDALSDVYNSFPSGDKKNEQREEKAILSLMQEEKSPVHADIPPNSSITADPNASQIHDTITPTKVDAASPAQEQPLKRVKPVEQVVTGSETSPTISTTNPTTTPETLTFSNTKLDPLVDQFGQHGSILSNGQEDVFSPALLDLAIIDMSFLQTFTQPFGQCIPPPGLKTTCPGVFPPITVPSHLDSNDHTKLGSKQDKTKKNLTSFEVLMNDLEEKFPTKTRAELMMLLKIAKTTFGDQGFRKKKIAEIVKRVTEILAGSEESWQMCDMINCAKTNTEC